MEFVDAVHVWFCCFFNNTMLPYISVREGGVKGTCLVSRAKFIVVLSYRQVNSQFLCCFLRQFGVSLGYK